MKLAIVLLMVTLVCYINAKDIGAKCMNHKECVKYAGCFEGTCQWTQNYLTKKNVRDSYVAKELDDPCLQKKHCRNLPNAECRGMICIEESKED